jgi:hypothetical protein
MAILRIWMLVVILSILLWLFMKVLKKPISFWIVALMTTIMIWGGLGVVYLLSVWFAGQ